MLDHIKINNFLLFDDFEIKEFKRINLIVGKNNVGKTALLEAIRIHQSEFDATVLNDVLNERGGLKAGNNDSYIHFFNKKNYNTSLEEHTFRINDFKARLLIKNRDNTFQTKLISEEYYINVSSSTSIDYPSDKIVIVPFTNGLTNLQKLWENIVLTPKEDDVIAILKETIEPNIKRFDIGKEIRFSIKGEDKPTNINAFGDGVKRILFIALALANAQDSILIIDELELGLHYSILGDLWKLIFKYAKLWNIQVFITTHSEDVIKNFNYVSSANNNEIDAQLIKIYKDRNGKIQSKSYPSNELAELQDLSLELR